MCKTAYIGTFNAENFWRNKNHSCLPELNDESTNNIISAMDELLFPLCKKEDVLLTRFKINKVFKKYLYDIGFLFNFNSEDMQSKKDYIKHSNEKCVFQLLIEQRDNKHFQDLLKESEHLNCYAVLPHTSLTCKRWDIDDNTPDYETVKKVNSKIYSHTLNDKIGIKKYGTIVNSSKDFENIVTKHSSDKGCIIKDPYGVSGKGSIIVSSQKTLKIIKKYISSQEEKGFITQFLIEPYFDKLSDFSCQIFIDKSGKFDVLSVQNIFNQNLSYSGSMTADNEFNEFLLSNDYFKIIKCIAEELFKEGYNGNVCLDSMILKNNEIVPIVEINARKSMGLINYNLDKFLNRFSTKSYFMFFYVGIKNDIEFENIINKFENLNILFKPDRKSGIILLSCNTLFINRELDQFNNKNENKIHKGKLYISVVSNIKEERQKFIYEARIALKSLSICVYN